MPIGIGLAIAGIAGAGASIFGASQQVSAEQAAIQAQMALYQQGLQTQRGYVNQAQQTLAPYINAGQQPLAWYNYLTGTGGVPGAAPASSGTLGDPNAPGGSQGSPLSPFQGGGGGSWSGLQTYQQEHANRQATTPEPVPAMTMIGPNGQPITIGGTNTFNPINAPLTAPFTAASLPFTPGYQFTLGQGTGASINAASAMGLGGGSGNELKGIADYTTGLAGTTYNQQFANYLTQNQQIANMLLGPASLGASAGGELASIYGGAGNAALSGATTTGAGVASSQAGIGNALAGGAAGVANSVGGSLLQYQLYNKLLGGSSNPGAPITPGYTTNALATSGAYGAPPLGVGGIPYDYGSNLFGVNYAGG